MSAIFYQLDIFHGKKALSANFESMAKDKDQTEQLVKATCDKIQEFLDKVPHSQVARQPPIPNLGIPTQKAIMSEQKSIIMTLINQEGKTNEDTKNILFDELKPADLEIEPYRSSEAARREYELRGNT